MSVVNNSFLSAFQDQESDLNEQLNQLLDKDSLAFQTKEKANQLIESVGSIKAFISGQPVGKYLLARGKAFVKDLKGLDRETAEDDAEGDAEGITRDPAEVPNPAFDPTEVESSEGVPNMLESSNPALANSYGATSTVAETSVDEASVASSSEGVLAGQSALIGKVSQIVKDDATLAKTSLEEGIGEGAGEGAGELAGEETAVSALDEIPVLGIIGLIAGAGLAIGAAVKKPKFSPPVDKINASYQVGI